MKEKCLPSYFEVEADSEEKAISNLYKSGDIVLSPVNIEHKQLAIVNQTSDELDWIPF